MRALNLAGWVVLTAILSIPFELTSRDFEKRIEKNFDVKPGGRLVLDSDKGSIDVRSHTSNKIAVVVFLEADTWSRDDAEEWFDRFELRFEQNGNDLEILGEWYDRWARRRNSLHVHFDIKVPKEYNLDLKTSGGSVEVDDINGEVELRTSGGSVRLGDIGGSVYAHTSGGSISVDSVNGNLRARSSGGTLRLSNVSGNLSAKTSGGSIHAELLKQVDEPVDLHTSGGSITLEVPENFKADIDASTSGGRIYSDLPLTIKGRFGKRSLRGKVNGGGELVSLRTSGGNIEIRER